jgi:hypothetical protein
LACFSQFGSQNHKFLISVKKWSGHFRGLPAFYASDSPIFKKTVGTFLG